jgi:hypothetical protein
MGTGEEMGTKAGTGTGDSCIRDGKGSVTGSCRGLNSVPHTLCRGPPWVESNCSISDAFGQRRQYDTRLIGRRTEKNSTSFFTSAKNPAI